jgi:hypothetical protein
MFITALILLSAVGVVAWAWFAMARVEADMRSLGSFEGMHFEIGPQAAPDKQGAKWPIPG